MTRENAAESLPLAPELAAMMKEEVDRTKNQKLPVNRAFEVIAKKSGLKFNTVRNYYYRYIHEKDNKNQQKSNSKNLRKNRRDQGVAGNSFKESEVRYLIMAMLQAQAQGESVRSCANRLANDDPKLMLRYQNKYRNIIANKQEYVKALMEEMDRKGIKYYDPFRKIYVNNATTQNDKEDDGISYVDSDSSKEELLGVIGQLITNMREIDGQSLEHFFKGLRDLSRMAVQWKKQQDDLNTAEDSSNKHREMLKERDSRIQELNTRIVSYEMRLEDNKKKIARLMSMFHQLMSVNRNFLNLSSAGKLSGLQDYTKELESLIKGYDAEMAE